MRCVMTQWERIERHCSTLDRHGLRQCIWCDVTIHPATGSHSPPAIANHAGHCPMKQAGDAMDVWPERSWREQTARQLWWRYITTPPCPRCSGSGKRGYPDVTTWRQIDGISAPNLKVTVDICDCCWGSGDSDRPWTNLRLMEAQMMALARGVQPGWAGAGEEGQMAEELKLIPEDHAENVCRPGAGRETCCLLLAGGRGWECGLGSSAESLLRDRARRGAMTAQGVNCKAPPEMPTDGEKEQGK